MRMVIVPKKTAYFRSDEHGDLRVVTTDMIRARKLIQVGRPVRMRINGESTTVVPFRRRQKTYFLLPEDAGLCSAFECLWFPVLPAELGINSAF
jgi:hypothetical protein